MVGEFTIGYVPRRNIDRTDKIEYCQNMSKEEFNRIVERLYYLEDIGIVSNITMEIGLNNSNELNKSFDLNNPKYHFDCNEGDKILELLLSR